MMYNAKIRQNKGPEVPRGALNHYFCPHRPPGLAYKSKNLKKKLKKKFFSIFFTLNLENFWIHKAFQGAAGAKMAIQTTPGHLCAFILVYFCIIHHINVIYYGYNDSYFN